MDEMINGRPWWALQHVPWWWKHGRPRDIWIVFEEDIGRFIKENKVNPISQEAWVGKEMTTRSASMKSGFDEPWWRFGGMRAPHLHYRNEVFLLTPKQWNRFSESIVNKFQAQLAAVNSISFDKMMELSEVMSDMPESR
jgi:hypothetical protein